MFFARTCVRTKKPHRPLAHIRLVILCCIFNDSYTLCCIIFKYVLCMVTVYSLWSYLCKVLPFSWSSTFNLVSTAKTTDRECIYNCYSSCFECVCVCNMPLLCWYYYSSHNCMNRFFVWFLMVIEIGEASARINFDPSTSSIIKRIWQLECICEKVKINSWSIRQWTTTTNTSTWTRKLFLRVLEKLLQYKKTKPK